MLVCNVSLRPPRTGISAGLVEAVSATDATATGNIVFATLVDDPASVRDRVDAFLGSAMVEATVTTIDHPDASIGAAVAYATWNPADLSNTTLSNGNLTATSVGDPNGVRSATGHSSGKYYFEYTNSVGSAINFGFGLSALSVPIGSGINTAGTVGVTASGNIWVNGGFTGTNISTVSPGLGVAVDLTAHLIWFRVTPSGNWNGSGTANPATGTGGLSISAVGSTLYPFLGWISGTAGQVTIANFGASAFSGAVPSGFTAGWP